MASPPPEVAERCRLRGSSVAGGDLPMDGRNCPPGPASRAALAGVCNIEPEAWDTQAEQQRLAWVEQQAANGESPQLTELDERVSGLAIETLSRAVDQQEAISVLNAERITNLERVVQDLDRSVRGLIEVVKEEIQIRQEDARLVFD